MPAFKGSLSFVSLACDDAAFSHHNVFFFSFDGKVLELGEIVGLKNDFRINVSDDLSMHSRCCILCASGNIFFVCISRVVVVILAVADFFFDRLRRLVAVQLFS